MNEDEILRREIERARETFGPKCDKYVGAVTVEAIRGALKRHGIETSSRDVFMQGVPIEVDLLIARQGAEPKHALLYRAQDVAVALEIKNRGCYGEMALEKTRRNFEEIRAHGPHIRCLYVTLTEREGYKWAATEENLGVPVYTLFWRAGSSKEPRFKSTGDWETLLADLEAARR